MSQNSPAKRRNLVLPHISSESSEIGGWLAAMNDCRDRTLKVIQGIEAAELDWDCPQSKNTIGTLLYHVAAIELDWLYAEILVQDFPEDSGEWFPKDVREDKGDRLSFVSESLQEHMARLEYVRDLTSTALVTMLEDDFREVRKLDAYDVTPQWILHHLLQHEAEHRAQIVTMRRLYREAHSG